MNQEQKIVVWVGMLLIVVTGLYVPVMTQHSFVVGDGAVVQIRYFVGYHWMFQPRSHEAPNQNYGRSFGYIDSARVLIQWSMICFVVGGLVWTLGISEPLPESPDSSSPVESD